MLEKGFHSCSLFLRRIVRCALNEESLDIKFMKANSVSSETLCSFQKESQVGGLKSNNHLTAAAAN